MSKKSDQLLARGHAARILNISVETFAAIARKGLIPFERDSNGRRLFKRADVEALKKKREKAKAAAHEHRAA